MRITSRVLEQKTWCIKSREEFYSIKCHLVLTRDDDVFENHRESTIEVNKCWWYWPPIFYSVIMANHHHYLDFWIMPTIKNIQFTRKKSQTMFVPQSMEKKSLSLTSASYNTANTWDKVHWRKSWRDEYRTTILRQIRDVIRSRERCTKINSRIFHPDIIIASLSRFGWGRGEDTKDDV